ncbi:MAG: chemotaxis protein CheA [Thermodesulfobacteriota bacterium]
MTGEQQGINELLDEMALKIMMIEPGDLSSVGELLELLEKLRASSDLSSLSLLGGMVLAFQQALQQIIMGELPDSAESYRNLGECVAHMQQQAAAGGGDLALLGQFSIHLQQIGLQIDPALLEKTATGPVGGRHDEPAFLKERELLDCFLDETADYLGSIENGVLSLERNPDDQEAVHAVFRAFHTIKGTAGSLSLEEISRLAHATESLLHEVRNGKMAMDSDVIEVVLGIADALKIMIAHVQDVAVNNVAYHVPDIADHLQLISGLMARKGNGVAGAEAGGGGARQAIDLISRIMANGKDVDVPGEETAMEHLSPLEQGQVPDFLKDSDLISGFIVEAFEHLETIELNVLELEQNPADPEIINNIFRPFHTIKGVSGFLNLTTINKLAHATENLLDDVRNNRLAMNSDIIDIVLGVGDYLRTMIQNVSDVLEKGPALYQRYDITDFLERISRCQRGEESVTPVPGGGRSRSEKRQEPPPTPAVMPTAVSLEPATASPDDPVRADTAMPTAGAGGKKNVEAAIKVDVSKLDGLVNAVGELVIMQAMVRHNPLIEGISDPKLNKDFAQLTRITTELQKTAMSMRMVPIRQTFQKMTRLVRDLSKKTGKKVDLVMEGEETEIDRNMVDSIYDPLVHMIRNSVDHGVQLPEERVRAGKPESGTVKLSAYQKGGNIVIEIADDGEGVNTAKIRQKAIERGLIGADDDRSDHEINNLIFLPGFSTADKITDVSGRGVGMDVVKKGVEKLRGKVELQSTPGEGSLFLMFLPLTLAIIDGIVVRVGPERYIIPTIAIRESMRPQMEYYNTVHGRGECLLIRDSLVPIIRLYRLFGVADACREISQGLVVVIENEGRQRALLVDELLGKQEVVIKSLGGYMKDVRGVAGGTILGDGRVGLILDLAGLINLADELGGGKAND